MPTNVACKLLDRHNGRCTSYATRKKHVADCVTLDRTKLDTLEWLPSSCAYRLRAAGEPLARMALSGVGRPRSRPPRRPVDARLDGQRSRCRRTGISLCRPPALTAISTIPTCRSRSPFAALTGARSLRLRYDATRHLLKLTCPPRTSRSAALRWAGEQRAWVDAQLAATPPAEPFVPGSRIPFEGREILLDWAESAPRTARLDRRRPELRRADRRLRAADRGLPPRLQPATLCRSKPPNMRRRPA